MSAAPASHGTPLAAEDAARLHMSAAANPMLITALLALDRPIAHEELESRLEARLVRHARFRKRVSEPRLGLGMPRWRDDPTFDVRHHVHRIDASLVPGTPALDTLVSDLASIPLSERRPLWRAHLVDGPDPALVMIVHHALADGAGLLALLAGLVDEQPSAPIHAAPAPVTGLRSRIGKIAAGAAAAGELALHRSDPKTALKGARLAGRKHLAFSTALSLETLRNAAHALGTTVTGLLLIAVAGACRAELRPGGSRDGLVLHALVPIDIRHGGANMLGNHYGSVLVPLPVGTSDLATRIAYVRAAAGALRSRSAGARAARIATAAGAMSAIVERLGVELFSRKASVVVSSVRGPGSELHLCGSSVRDIMVWAPASGSIAVSVTLMSYAERVRIGIAVDARVIDDARRVVRELELELERICSFASSSAAYT
jgi:hypothetical protein